MIIIFQNIYRYFKMKKKQQIKCSGSTDSGSKHPEVYFTINSEKVTICSYCSRQFIIIEKNNTWYIESSESIYTQHKIEK